MLSVLEDIAEKLKIKTIHLLAVPTAVSYYLDLERPFAFNSNVNRESFMTSYNKLKSTLPNKNAKRRAGNVFGAKGVSMTLKKPRKNRRRSYRTRALRN
jgi:uncharacterized protein YktA (UPF0223 family)